MGLLFTSEFEEALENATSEMLPNAQEDLSKSLEVCDMIKGKRVGPKEAMRALKLRLQHRNPNVQMLALKLTDACFKNTGQHFLLELASREFVDAVADLIRSPDSVLVSRMATDYFQLWALMCQEEPGLGYINEVYMELKRSGIQFQPPPRNLDRSFVKTQAPPEWIDADVCNRCRVQFTITNRKHHCRNCGNVFCQDCSSRSLSLPEFGIPDAVRVCEPCFVRKVEAKAQYQKSAPLPATPPLRPEEEEPTEDADLALAIKLSLQESQPASQRSSVDAVKEKEKQMLKAAIEASLREAAPPAVVLSEIDKENARLFAQLVDKLSVSGQFKLEPEIEALALQMESLKMTLKASLQNIRQPTPELAGVLATLEISLTKYAMLKRMVISAPVISAPVISAPTYPAQQPVPHTVPNVYHQVPSQPTQPAEPPRALLDDEPLIQL